MILRSPTEGEGTRVCVDARRSPCIRPGREGLRMTETLDEIVRDIKLPTCNAFWRVAETSTFAATWHFCRLPPNHEEREHFCPCCGLRWIGPGPASRVTLIPDTVWWR